MKELRIILWRFQLQILCDVSNGWIWSIGVMIMTGESRRTRENLFQCHSVHHKSHLKWPGIKPGPLVWQVDDWQPETRRGRCCVVNFSCNNQHACIKTATVLGATAKLRIATFSFVMSIWPHGTSRLPMDGFSWNLIFEYISKVCRKKSCFIKIRHKKGQRALYLKTNIHFWSYLAQFF